jgi:hypothetical protein
MNSKLFLYICIGFTLLKLILISGEEIITVSSGHDDFWHINTALRGLWLYEYKWDSMLHLPLYALWLKLTSYTGISQRIIIEVAYCISVIYLVWVLKLSNVRRIFCWATLILLIFHPVTFQSFNRCGAEVLLVPVILFGFATFIHLLLRGFDKAGLVITNSIVWSFAWNLRKESIVIFFTLLSFGIAILLVSRMEKKSEIIKKICLGSIAPLAACILLSLIICATNYFRWGVFAGSITEMKGYKSCYKSLQQIHVNEYMPFIPVSRKARNIAYSVSPQFKKLEPHLEGEVGKRWGAISQAWVNSLEGDQIGPDEIAAGWFYWALHDAVIAAGKGNSPRDEDKFLSICAKEINSGLRAANIQANWVPVTYLDPEFKKWVRRFPISFMKVCGSFFQTSNFYSLTEDPNVYDGCGRYFDAVLNRRRSHLVGGLGEIIGWVISPTSYVNASLLYNGIPITKVAPMSRPDISIKNDVGFLFKFILPEKYEWKNISIKLEMSNAASVIVAIGEVDHGNITTLSDGTKIKIDGISKPQQTHTLSRNIQQLASSLHLYAIKALSIISLILIPVFSIRQFLRSDSSFRQHHCAIIFIASIYIFGRIGFFALLDATSWPGNIPRYLASAMPLYVIFCMISLSMAFDLKGNIKIQNH